MPKCVKVIKKHASTHIGDTTTSTSIFTRKEREREITVSRIRYHVLEVQGLHGSPGWPYFDFNGKTNSQLAHPFHVAPDKLSHLDHIITHHLQKKGRGEDNE